MKRHQDHIKARYKSEENVANINGTPEDKQPVIYKGDVSPRQTRKRNKKRPNNKQKSIGEILKERRTNKFRHGLRYKQTPDREGEIPQKGDNESRLTPADTIRTEERELQMTEPL